MGAAGKRYQESRMADHLTRLYERNPATGGHQYAGNRPDDDTLVEAGDIYEHSFAVAPKSDGPIVASVYVEEPGAYDVVPLDRERRRRHRRLGARRASHVHSDGDTDCHSGADRHLDPGADCYPHSDGGTDRHLHGVDDADCRLIDRRGRPRHGGAAGGAGRADSRAAGAGRER